MKRIILSLLIVASFCHCKKIKEAAVINFKITNEQKMKVPKVTYIPGVTEVLPSFGITVNSNSETIFNDYKTSAENVEDIRLSKLTLSIDQPSTQNFNFLKSIDVYISSGGSAKKKVAYLTQVPLNVNTLDLNTTGEKLDEYLKKPTYDLTVDAQIDESTTEDINTTAKMIFDVRARLLK